MEWLPLISSYPQISRFCPYTTDYTYNMLGEIFIHLFLGTSDGHAVFMILLHLDTKLRDGTTCPPPRQSGHTGRTPILKTKLENLPTSCF